MSMWWWFVCLHKQVVQECSSGLMTRLFLVEFMIVMCWPHYLPREFTTVLNVTLYVVPGANVRELLNEGLYRSVSSLQTVHLDRFFFATSDFTLNSLLTKFYQHIDFITCRINMRNLIYTNTHGAYKAAPRSHLGCLDHAANSSVESTSNTC